MRHCTTTLLFTLFIFFVMNSLSSQITIDGNHCPHQDDVISGPDDEWGYPPHAYDGPSTSGSSCQGCNIISAWGISDGSDLFVAVSRNATGTSAWLFYFNADCNANTGDLSNGGAEFTMRFQIKNNDEITNKELLEWNGSAYIYASTIIAEVGDSLCNNSSTDLHFLEMGVNLNSLFDPCDTLNIGCTGLQLTRIETRSGNFNSSLSDTLDHTPIDIYVNTPPVAAMSVNVLNPCLSENPILLLDASGSTDIDNDVLTYRWQIEKNQSIIGTINTTNDLETFPLSEAGTYTVYLAVFDELACEVIDTMTSFEVFSNPSCGNINVSNVNCFGETDGTIEVAPTGGLPPYTYSVDGINYQTSNVFYNLSPGLYTVYISDANGCSDTCSNIEIVVPELDCDNYVDLQFNGATQITNVSGFVGDKWRVEDIYTGYDAFIEIIAVSDVISICNIDKIEGPIPGAWSPEIRFLMTDGSDSYVDWKITMLADGTNTPTALPLPSRVTSYDVDGNSDYNEIHGHIGPSGFILNNPTDLTLLDEPPFTVVDGEQDEHPGISNDDDVKVTFYYSNLITEFNVRLGVRARTDGNSICRQYAISFDNCPVFSNPVVIPVIPEIFGDVDFCETDLTHSYHIENNFTGINWIVTGGTINSGQGTDSISVTWNGAGNHTITVETTDANSCTSSKSSNVMVNATPSVIIGSDFSICDGTAVNISAIASGGTPPYNFTWSTNETTQAISVSPNTPTTYTVTVTDSKGCSSTEDVEVSLLSSPQVNVIAPSMICNSVDIQFAANVTPGDGVIQSYLWQGPNGFSSSATSTCYSCWKFELSIRNWKCIYAHCHR